MKKISCIKGVLNQKAFSFLKLPKKLKISKSQ